MRSSSYRRSRPFGIQLYTLRDKVVEDASAVLRHLADCGYTQIESYEGPKGMFWDKGPTGFKRFINDLGMELTASHCNIFEGIDQKIEQAASVGMRYLICPWVGKQNSLDDYKRLADTFNQTGEKCKAAGIRFAYHNHDYSFRKLDEVYPQELFLTQTDPGLVDYEMDFYWVVVAGEDPLQWLQRHPNRFTLGHVKDGKDGQTLTLGRGMIDFQSLLPKAAALGMNTFLVEQEHYEGTTSMDCARDNAEFMKALNWG